MVLVFLPAMWETQIEIQIPGFSLVKPWMLQAFGHVKAMDGRSLCLSPFQIKQKAHLPVLAPLCWGSMIEWLQIGWNGDGKLSWTWLQHPMAWV